MMKTIVRTLLMTTLFVSGIYSLKVFAASPPTVLVTADHDLILMNQFCNKVRALRDASRFDELESLANEARSGKVRFGNGSWEINQFYATQELPDEVSDEKWKNYDDLYQRWVNVKPKSITARIAQAGFYIRYAWRARGSGWGYQVTEEGAKLFQQRLAYARKILEDAKSLEPSDPVWWLSMMTVAIGQGWSHADFDRLFEEAKSIEPQFWGYDAKRSMYLMSRWYGAEGEWEQATEKEAERAGGIGMEVYSRVALYQSDWYNNVFKETNVSWQKTREGFEIMRKNYPNSLADLSEYCRMAWLAGDRETTHKLCEELNGRCLLSAWGRAEDFIACQLWAYRQ